MDELSFEGERILFHWTLDGTYSGPGGKGNLVHISGHEEWSIDADGVIRDSQGHMDLEDYARQLAGE